MPQPVAELVEAARIVPPSYPAFLVEVRDVGDLSREAPLDLGGAAARQFEFTEIARERHLSLVV